ncbi:hypothetical protein AUEXF2481DRAFT_7025 [Aureobasidium subglaciale EXF-2481]|uniref:C3H1-type domain-containing protein n=1 Tax=Aureobasidium subglaciale (strain EXF-2481) TaxID=1043005 RepID=A0A074Y5S6_AURSE|nr:uncharacterized protein AUEXF2481DRAFT_7025 [Aureobasidium subglaciale EXF-2481]KEQ93070.1 hypothetical protein AUEXF2481DRAFT_7025 [Aureobasidium subglaciale EXF-2481]
MDLRQYLVAPYEQSPQPQQYEEVLTREQVVRGLAAHPDLLASIIRSGSTSPPPALTTPPVPTSPRVGSHGSKRSQDLVPFAPMSGPGTTNDDSPVPPAIKAPSILAASPTPTHTSPTTLNNQNRLRKQERYAKRKATIFAHAETRRTRQNAKYLDAIPYLNNDVPYGTSCDVTTKSRVCFFWYHGLCTKKGKECRDAHVLMEIPGFVQPPEGFVHQEKCLRDWCPGDWMWEHDPDALDVAEALDTAEDVPGFAEEEDFEMFDGEDMDM